MEMRGCDFAHRNSDDVLVITLGTQEDYFDLRLMVPTKGIYDDLNHAAELIDNVMDGNADGAECIDKIYSLIARAMSHNTEGKIISPEYLNEINFTFHDAAIFLGDYMNFLLLLTSSKN